MKVVGFNYLKKQSKRKRKTKIFCISNVFKNGVIVMGILLLLMIFGLVNSSFTINLKSCIDNFISSMTMIF